jgi:hypothetical protein
MAARVPRIGIVGSSNVYVLTYVERRGLCRAKVKLIGSVRAAFDLRQS